MELAGWTQHPEPQRQAGHRMTSYHSQVSHTSPSLSADAPWDSQRLRGFSNLPEAIQPYPACTKVSNSQALSALIQVPNLQRESQSWKLLQDAHLL